MSLTVEIASVPDRDHWVGEIWDGAEMVAEIARLEDGTPTIEIYPGNRSRTSKFDFIEFCSAIIEIRNRLAL